MTLPDWPALMSPQTAADYFQIDVSTLNRLRQRKEFPPPVMIGQSPRYRRVDLDAHAARLRAATA